MEQGLHQWNAHWNTAGTLSLKALANKVLERNKGWNKYGTGALNSVPRPDQTVPLGGTVGTVGVSGAPGMPGVSGTPGASVMPGTSGTDPEADFSSQQEALSYEFEERAAIMEYDGGLTREEAERLARIDREENLPSSA